MTQCNQKQLKTPSKAIICAAMRPAPDTQTRPAWNAPLSMQQHTTILPAPPDAAPFRLAPEGALLSLPARASEPRRVWTTQGPVQRFSAPRPGAHSFYAPDFFLTDPAPWLLPADADAANSVREFLLPDLLTQIASDNPDAPVPARPNWQPPPRAFFDECFADLQAQFKAGHLSKVVPVFFEQASFPTPRAQVASWIAGLLRAPASLTPYGCWTEAGGILGASPELLFEVGSGTVRTAALAGTLPAPLAADTASQLDAEQHFLNDPKERREHDLVIEGIAQALAPYGTVTVGATTVIKLPTLWHLQTPIDAALHGTPDFATLVRALHPTPALGGSPHDAALAWLRRQDAHQPLGIRRGGFGAPFGLLRPDGSGFCLVAVRGLMWQRDMLSIGAGCGIIRESQPDREWEELRHKRDSVKRLLSL